MEWEHDTFLPHSVVQDWSLDQIVHTSVLPEFLCIVIEVVLEKGKLVLYLDECHLVLP